jgi:hypothetical protein
VDIHPCSQLSGDMQYEGIASLPWLQVSGVSVGRTLDGCVAWGTSGEGLVKQPIEIRRGKEGLVEETGDRHDIGLEAKY